MVEKISAKVSTFPYVYEPPRHIELENERKMAAKMVKVIDKMVASEDFKNKMKTLYMQSDELAWLGEHFNRDNVDVEAEFK